MTGTGGIVEIQGTAEGDPFSDEQFIALLTLAKNACTDLTKIQNDTL